MSGRYAWWLMDRCPRWLMRLLPNATEMELRDMTRPGDRCPYLMPTGRSRWIWFGVALPWTPLREMGPWRPTTSPDRGQFLTHAETMAEARESARRLAELGPIGRALVERAGMDASPASVARALARLFRAGWSE